MARALSEEIRRKLPSGRQEDEFVFYCPVTVSSSAIEREVQTIADGENQLSYIRMQIGGGLALKIRLYCKHMRLCGRNEAAERNKDHLLSLLNDSLRGCR